MYKYVDEYTVRGYAREEGGTLSIVSVPMVNGRPHNAAGRPLTQDGELVSLVGWPDNQAESYEGGAILVAVDTDQ